MMNVVVTVYYCTYASVPCYKVLVQNAKILLARADHSEGVFSQHLFVENFGYWL
jgi:uncharacterized pyridoxamine 5'-phosphate oxidase family protein